VPPEEKEDASDEGDDEDFESSGSDEL
jgi:hypothetical protein